MSDYGHVPIKNKKQLVQFVKDQMGITLENDSTDSLNRNRNRLYTKIPYAKECPLFSFFYILDVRLEKHLDDKYWILFKKRRDGSPRNP